MADAGPAKGELTADSASAHQRAPARFRPRTIGAAGEAALGHIRRGAPGTYWSQLSAVDFMNSSLAFAALAVVCGFPFLAVIHASVGEDVRQAIITRMGLNAPAARDVNASIAPGHRAVSALTVFGAILLVLGAIGMASTIQAWYQRIYDQPPVTGGFKRVAYQLVGVAAFSAYIAIDVSVLHSVSRAGGGAASVFILTFVFAVLFWWCSAYFLLYRKVGWRQLLPAGVATGFCITGLGVFSSLLFSDQITSGETSYGPAGVVVAVISYLIGYGVCLHLGAVFGRVWNDWQSVRHRRVVGNQVSD